MKRNKTNAPFRAKFGDFLERHKKRVEEREAKKPKVNEYNKEYRSLYYGKLGI